MMLEDLFPSFISGREETPDHSKRPPAADVAYLKAPYPRTIDGVELRADLLRAEVADDVELVDALTGTPFICPNCRFVGEVDGDYPLEGGYTVTVECGHCDRVLFEGSIDGESDADQEDERDD